MNGRVVSMCVLAAMVIAGAGTAVARVQHHHHAPAPRHTQAPATPSPTPHATAASAPVSSGHHHVSGPDAPTEHVVIHGSGSVGAVTGNVSYGNTDSGAVGTPKPKP